MPDHLLLIRWKAMLMLVAFTVNFCVVCHCAASSGKVMRHCHACCKGAAPKGGDRHGCQGMQAVKFNLLEKQVASNVTPGEPPVIVINYGYSVLAPVGMIVDREWTGRDHWNNKHAPPDLRVLYQSFLI